MLNKTINTNNVNIPDKCTNRLQKDMLCKTLEQRDNSFTNNFIQFTQNFLETFHFTPIWKMSRKSEFCTLKNTTSIPITSFTK